MAEKVETALTPRANGGYDYLVEEEDRSTDDLRRDIAHRRESIVHTVDQASRKVRELLGWREQVRRYPYGALAAAAGLGFVLVSLRHRKTAGERLVTTLTKNVDAIGGSLRNSIDPANRTSSGLAQTVGATLIAMMARSLLHAAGNRFVTKPQTRSNERRMP